MRGVLDTIKNIKEVILIMENVTKDFLILGSSFILKVYGSTSKIKPFKKGLVH